MAGLTYTLPADLYGSQKTVDAQTGKVVSTSAPDLNSLLPGVTVTARRPVTQTQQQKVAVRPSTANESRTAIGPVSPTEKSNYDFKSLRFPTNLGDFKARHWIKFTPNVQIASRYQVAMEKGGNVMGIADSNRFNLQGQLSSNQRAIADGVASDVSAGLKTYKTIMGAINGLEAPSETALGAAAQILARGAAGYVVGAFSGDIVKEIKLGRKTRRAAGSISLYMPDTVNVTVVNDYDKTSMTQALGVAGLVAQAGTSVLEQINKAGVNATLGNLAGTPNSAEIAGALAEKTGLFGNGITDALLFSAGYAQNPQVELLFKTIQNREFLFDFKFVPRDPTEAAEIIEIIKQFRFFAAPEIPSNGSGRYFVPPSEFDIDFMIGSDRNTKIPRISTCVLQGIDVNYGSAGQWTAFKDGMPVEIAMQLRFMEVEIMHKELIRQGF